MIKLSEFPNPTAHWLFEQSVYRYPDKTAVVFHGQPVTYSQLNIRVNRLAATLRREGVGPGTVVGMMLERSPAMVVGMLAILKSGGAYLPIDPNYPDSRIEYLLEDSGSLLLLTQDSLKKRANRIGIRSLDIFNEKLYPEAGAIPDHQSQSSDLAYVIYTSGSTGKPKGVAVEHRSLVSFIASLTEEISFNPEKSILALTSLSFDISIIETLLPLTVGMTVVIADEREQADMELLNRCIVRNKINMLQLTPSRLRQLIGDGQGLSTLSYITELLVGGEVFSDQLFTQVQDSPCKIYNLYGPTETTVYSLIKLLRKGEKVTLGKPISNTRVYIADHRNRLVEDGTEGELLIGGPSLARGYLNAPELTNKSFQLASFQPFERLYHTGDRVRWTPTAEVEFLGRIDRQIKLRGHRIELEEIENNLLSDHQIKAAVVEALGGPDQAEHLCAYVVPHAGIKLDTLALRKGLARDLPEHMIPSFFVELAELPLMPNGKIDHKALPRPMPGSRKAGVRYEGLEKRIVSIWGDLLGIQEEKIDSQDDFFELGGHSLNASLTIARIHSEFNVKIAMDVFFERSTPQRLAEYINESTKTRYEAIAAAEVKDRYALSSEQARQFILNQLAPQTTAYNLAEIYEVQGPLDIQRVEAAFRKLVNRHESLRTSFEIEDGVPYQKVHLNVPLEIRPRQVTENTVSEAVREFVRPFDLSHAPLLRVEVLRLTSQHFFLMLDIHHIISDGFSRDILLKEFFLLYNDRELLPLSVHYKDYAEVQHTAKASNAIEKQRAYWLEMFREPLTPLNLPIDYARSEVRRFEGLTMHFKIKSPALDRLKTLAREENATLFMTLFAVVSAFLAHVTGQEDLVLATPIAGRNHADLEPIIGMFVNTLPLRMQPDCKKPFRDYLRNTRLTLLQAFENQNFQFDELVNALGLNRDPARNPLFDVMFVLQDTETKPLEIPGVDLTPCVWEMGTSKVDLTIHMREIEKELCCYFEYDTHLFERGTIKSICDAFLAFLDRLLDHPSDPISKQRNATEQPLSQYGNVAFAFPEDQYELCKRPE